MSGFCLVWLVLAVPCSIGILVPWPGIETMPSGMEAQSLKHWTTREVLQMNYLFIFLLLEELAILAIRVSYR